MSEPRTFTVFAVGDIDELGLRGVVLRGDEDAIIKAAKLFRQEVVILSADVAGDIIRALKASEGYLLNAKIDLETGAPKRTAINTIDGGLNVVRAALASIQKEGE